MLAASGAGAFVGSMIPASLGAFARRGVLIVAFALALGVLLALLAVQSAIVLAALLAALVSLTIQAHITSHVTLYQMRGPSELQGRMVGLSATIAQSGMGIGSLVLGSLGTLFGLNLAFVLAGAVIIAASAYVVLAFPVLRDRVV